MHAYGHMTGILVYTHYNRQGQTFWNYYIFLFGMITYFCLASKFSTVLVLCYLFGCSSLNFAIVKNTKFTDEDCFSVDRDLPKW